MAGARAGLRVTPTDVPREAWPEPLRGCPRVTRLDEQVVDPASMIAATAMRESMGVMTRLPKS